MQDFHVGIEFSQLSWPSYRNQQVFCLFLCFRSSCECVINLIVYLLVQFMKYPSRICSSYVECSIPHVFLICPILCLSHPCHINESCDIISSSFHHLDATLLIFVSTCCHLFKLLVQSLSPWLLYLHSDTCIQLCFL